MPIALPSAFSLKSDFSQMRLSLTTCALLDIQREDSPQLERGVRHEIAITED